MKKLLRCIAVAGLLGCGFWSQPAQSWDYPSCNELASAGWCDDGRLVCTWDGGPVGGGACVCTGEWECW